MSIAHALTMGLRTGNLVADMLLASLLVALLPRAQDAASRAWTWLLRRGRRHTLTVYQKVDGIFLNRTYDAVVDVIARALEREFEGDCEVEATPTGRDVRLRSGPASRRVLRQPCGAEVGWTLLFDQEKDPAKGVPTGRRVSQRVVLDSTDPRALFALVKRAQAEWAATAFTWTPRVWTMAAGAGDSTSWTPHAMPAASFDAIAMPGDQKRRLVDDLTSFLGGEERYARTGCNWRRGYLLHGSPGGGKTTALRAIATLAQLPVYSLNLAEFEDDRAMARAFATIPARGVLALEDVDTARATWSREVAEDEAVDDFLAPPGAAGPLAAAKPPRKGITLGALLNHLDGIWGAHGRITVMTTNHPERLDPALVRPGRADVHIRLGLCTAAMLAEMQGMFYPDRAGRPVDPPLPPDRFSPAAVSSAYICHPGDPAAAHRQLLADAADPLDAV